MKNNLNSFWADLIVEELIRCGVDHFCICGGSRSTPLVAAVGRNKRAKSIVFHDERGSAFYALLQGPGIWTVFQHLRVMIGFKNQQ